MDYHPVVGKIRSLLDSRHIWYETFEHREVRTCDEAADVRTGYTLEQGSKALILRVKNAESGKFFAMLVMPAHLKFDSGKVKKTLKSNDIRFATAEEVGQITGGVLPGGVPPFGTLFNLRVIADPALFANEKIVFNAGDRRYSIAMKTEDYRSIVNPEVVSIV